MLTSDRLPITNGILCQNDVAEYGIFTHVSYQAARVKHRVKENWLKMYDKAGSVLRVGVVINNPEAFKVRKKVIRNGQQVMEWVPMRKGVAYLFRFQEVSRLANQRYLDALAVVEDPTRAIQGLDAVTTRKESSSGRGVRAFNPLSRDDAQLFKAMMAGEHCIRGLSNAEIRSRLQGSPHLRDLANNTKRQSAKISRILNRFQVHKLIAKIPHTRRWLAGDRRTITRDVQPTISRRSAANPLSCE